MTGEGPTAWPLGDWVHRQAEKTPDRRALRFEGQDRSYAAFADRIDRLAAGLRAGLGLRPGERIAWLGRNHPDLLVLLFAAARLGSIVVPLNWRLAPPEHKAILQDAAPAVIVAEEVFSGEVEALVAGVGDSPPPRPIALDFVRDGWLGFGDLLLDAGDLEPCGAAADPVLIVYTSGTTGLAKGAVLTQDALRWNAANSVDLHTLTAEDLILTSLPLFHVGGLNIQTIPAFAAGAEVFLEAGFDPAATLRQIAEARPTLTVLVPAMMKALIDQPGFDEADLSSLRQITTGSSIVPVELIETFHARNIPVTQVYGTTETAPIAVYQRVQDAFQTLGSTGTTAKHGEMSVLGEDGKVNEPGVQGISGEIQIRGPQVMSGYWNDPSATDAAFDDGWFRTGDIGRLDDAGNLHVEARADDLIKSGGERIYPAEIECILRAVDGVDEVVVVGRGDATWGEVPVAVVVPAADAELDAGRLLQHLDGRLARFKWPKEVRFVDTLPRSALGKVLRYRLRALIERS